MSKSNITRNSKNISKLSYSVLRIWIRMDLFNFGSLIRIRVKVDSPIRVRIKAIIQEA